MSEYTSTVEGFQRAMKWSLTGPPGEAAAYVEATAIPAFYQIINGQRIDYDDYVKHIDEWRGKISDYEPVLHEFLRDGDQLAARMTGTIKISGADTFFESFIFGKVEESSGKMEWMIERSVWGPAGQVPEHGAH